MFDDLETAFSMISPDALREILVSLLAPVTVLVLQADPMPESLSYMGGTPTMSATLEWSRPDPSVDIEAIAARGGPTHAPGIRQALASNPPYAFIGQIDLAQIQIPEWPEEGRLLFFYDIMVGPWDPSQRSAKVLWDRSPPTSAVLFPPPAELIEAEKAWNDEARAYVPESLVIDEEMRRLMRDAGMSDAEIDSMENTEITLPEHEDQRVYFGLQQYVTPKTSYQTPTLYNAEWPDFAARVSDLSNGRFSRNELEAEFGGSGLMENIVDAGAAFQLGGLPTPEQDDPRYTAATVLLFGKPYISHEEHQAHFEKIADLAQSLRLLFQVPIAAWVQEDTEGTVYYLITEDDFKARNFDRVIAVYQQT